MAGSSTAFGLPGCDLPGAQALSGVEEPGPWIGLNILQATHGVADPKAIRGKRLGQFTPGDAQEAGRPDLSATRRLLLSPNRERLVGTFA
jgi:hypothetical protein